MESFEISGHLFYITSVTYGRLQLFKRPSFVIPLYDSLNFYRYKLGFKLIGYVIMPDHIHLLIWPRNEEVIADFMSDFKTFTAKRIVREAEVEGKQEWLQHFKVAGAKTERGENKVWQDSYWEVELFSEKFVRQKLNYIHLNPVRAGLVSAPEDYLYSSYRNYQFNETWLVEIDRGWL